MESFLDRLNFLLCGRAVSTWATGLGFGNAIADRMRAGRPPAAESLTAITRAENVSLTWLLEGRGKPFLVNKVETDAEGAELIESLLRDEPDWVAIVATCGPRYAVVLTQPGQFQKPKGPWVKYRIVEILSGPLGALTLEKIVRLRGGPPGTLQRELPPEIFSGLCGGTIGTYGLLGDVKHPGVLADAQAVEDASWFTWDLRPEVE